MPAAPPRGDATTWVVLLRGINVGTAKRIGMADLRNALDTRGYDDVRTILQSGNVVFGSSASATMIERDVAALIRSEFGMDVKVLARTAKEIATTVTGNPFVKKGVDTKELHAAFLSQKVGAAKLKSAVHPNDILPDEYALGDRVLYVRLPNGNQGAKVPNWDRALGVDVTQRNWKTVTKLHAATQ